MLKPLSAEHRKPEVEARKASYKLGPRGRPKLLVYNIVDEVLWRKRVGQIKVKKS